VNDSNPHLSSDTLQAYLDGELPAEQIEPVQTHLAGCRRCAAELEGWQVLLAELDDLPALVPSSAFGDRVLAGVRATGTLVAEESEATPATTPARPSWWRRLLPGWTGGQTPDRHLTPELIQDLLDGALPGRRLVMAREHLADCGQCRGQVAEWEPVFSTLAEIPRLEPSPGFADRVMEAHRARSRAPTPVPAGLERVLDWAEGAARAAGRFVPTTPGSWGVLGAVAVVPTLVVMTLVGAVVAHPLVSWEALATFLRWRVADGLGAAGAWASQWLIQSPVAMAAWELAGQLAAAPGAALALLIGAWTLTLAAVWILYRNVLAPSPQVGRHE